MHGIWPELLLGIVAAFTTAGLLIPVRAVLLRFRIVDRPNLRSSHTTLTVRGAGVAIVAVAALVCSVAGAGAGAVIGSIFVVLGLVSFIDDIRGLRPALRLAVQVGAAVVGLAAVAHAGGVVMLPACGVVCGAIAFVWVAGYTNAFNFMDGINGIAAMQAIAGGVGTAFVAHRLGVPVEDATVRISLVIAGAALGFLPHNFPKARVFMGDVGSAPLGLLLSLLAVWVAVEVREAWVLFWIGLLHANFVLDTGITLVRRALRGERVSQPHREHFYQRLVRAGYSHTFVTLSEAAIQAVVVVAIWQATNASWAIRIGVAAGVILVWLAFFAFAEAKFQAFQRRAASTPAPTPE